MTVATVLNTHCLEALVRSDPELDNWRNKNFSRVDPEGVHVVSKHMLHNDGYEVKAWVLVKMKNTMDPVEVMLHTSPELFMRMTLKVEVETDG
jgi:hypothetical protein